MHGGDVVVTLVSGTAAQREIVQEALDRWWGPLMQMHGPRSDRAKDRDIHWKIKAKTSEELRQEFLGIYVSRIRELGLMIPDADLSLDPATGVWAYDEPDWNELRTVVTNHGPKSQERLDFRRADRGAAQRGPEPHFRGAPGRPGAGAAPRPPGAPPERPRPRGPDPR